MNELDTAYKMAFIKYVKLLPQLIETTKQDIQTRERQIEAMNTLARSIHLMPATIRMHP